MAPLKSFKKHLPLFQNIIPVFAVITFFLYTWTIFWFFWNVPSIILYLNIGDILSMIGYYFAINIFQSLFVLIGLLALSLVLPASWLRENFIVNGSGLFITTFIWVTFPTFYSEFILFEDYSRSWKNYLEIIIIGLSLGAIFILLNRRNFYKRFLANIADRMVILLYIWVPLSVLGLGMVIIRNIGG